MERRGLFGAAIAATLGAVGLGARAAEAPARMRVVYHLSDLDKVAFVLANIGNHIDGTGGPGAIDIALVVHGPALQAFKTAGVDARISSRAEALSKARVDFEACINTMRGYGIALGDLLPGFVVAEKGGVVRLAELQSQGYLYLRP